jgi:hypothetical protein
MGLGLAKDIDGQITQRGDKSFAWYAYVCQSIGATRLEEAKLVEIKFARKRMRRRFNSRRLPASAASAT